MQISTSIATLRNQYYCQFLKLLVTVLIKRPVGKVKPFNEALEIGNKKCIFLDNKLCVK